MCSPFMHDPEQPRDGYSNGQCLKVGVLTNPRSGGNKKKGRAVAKLLVNWPEVTHREAFEPVGFFKALSDFSSEGIELLVINGGDGTVQAILTILGNEKIFARPPLLSLLCAGTTSMLPRDVGVAGSPVAALQRVLEWSKSTNRDLVVQSRSILRVQRDSEALYGMFFGAGAICEGIRIFHNKDNPMGWRGQLMPMLTMVRLLLAIFCNRVPPFMNNTRINCGTGEQRADLLVLASTLDRLFLGMRPYWGTEDGPLRYTAVSTNPRYLLRVIFSLFGSGRCRYATPANGYASHNVEEVQLDMEIGFTLDGELYEKGKQPITISSAGPALFVCSS
jgi:diacylglycerol kinase (ATP)